MTKKELEKLDRLSPYGKEPYYSGWHVPLELHNGNVHALVFWMGMLMRLEDAPSRLNKKIYDRYSGKTLREYEWTVLKKVMLNELNRLDKDFKKEIRKKNRQRTT